jgi:SAM-dependent methyltransferase
MAQVVAPDARSKEKRMSDQSAYRQGRESVVRRVTRRVLYSRYLHPVLKRWLAAREAGSPHRTPAYWDALATRCMRSKASFLGGYAQIDVRNAIAATLIRSYAPTAKSVLDVGCAAGLLGVQLAAQGVRRYVGIDLSEVAIQKGRESLAALAGPAFSFQLGAADLVHFSPDGERFDAIVFNEVLYYIPVETAVAQAVRLSGFLQPQGVICVTCLGDAKSESVFRELLPHFEWLTGFLYQECTGPRYRIDPRSVHPACQSALLRPRSEQGPIRRDKVVAGSAGILRPAGRRQHGQNSR